jgi:hypothetical protein
MQVDELNLLKQYSDCSIIWASLKDSEKELVERLSELIWENKPIDQGEIFSNYDFIQLQKKIFSK